MADDLRAKIAEAIEKRVKDTVFVDPAMYPGVVGQPFAATFYDLADVALAVVADWLRAEAMELRRIADRATFPGTLSTAAATTTPHSLLTIANGLEDRARSLTQPSTEGRTDG